MATIQQGLFVLYTAAPNEHGENFPKRHSPPLCLHLFSYKIFKHTLLTLKSKWLTRKTNIHVANGFSSTFFSSENGKHDHFLFIYYPKIPKTIQFFRFENFPSYLSFIFKLKFRGQRVELNFTPKHFYDTLSTFIHFYLFPASSYCYLARVQSRKN